MTLVQKIGVLWTQTKTKLSGLSHRFRAGMSEIGEQGHLIWGKKYRTEAESFDTCLISCLRYDMCHVSK